MKLLYTIHKYDVFLFTWLLNTRNHTVLARISRYLSKTGDGPPYGLLAATLYWREDFDSPLLQTMIWAFLIERPIYFMLKNSFKRNRPQAALENFRSLITPSDRFSFPSGHTSAAFLMATLLSYFFPVFLVPLYGWAILVACSRVVLGVHFPTDTLVGALLGIITAIFSLEQVLA